MHSYELESYWVNIWAKTLLGIYISLWNKYRLELSIVLE